jgi:hypothetical protein
MPDLFLPFFKEISRQASFFLIQKIGVRSLNNKGVILARCQFSEFLCLIQENVVNCGKRTTLSAHVPEGAIGSIDLRVARRSSYGSSSTHYLTFLVL